MTRLSHLPARVRVVVACAVVLACGAIAAIGHLQSQATASRDAELRLVGLRLDLAHIQDVPWGALPDEGDDPADVRNELAAMADGIEDTLAGLARDGRLVERRRIDAPFQRMLVALWEVYDLVSRGRQDETARPSSVAAHQAAAADREVARAAGRHRARSARMLRRSRIEGAAVILVLLAAFALFYTRATRARRTAESLAAENRRLLAQSRTEALTDALTGLANRRALLDDLRAARPEVRGEHVLLALFDLNGFKQYNDSFGHPAGDVLLARLGGRLAATMEGVGRAYRMGGDEFCIVSSVGEDAGDAIAALGAAALSEDGAGFTIGAAYGFALIPGDTTSVDEALRLADQRMYADKASARIPTSRQSADVLLRLLAERDSALPRHTAEVAALAGATAAHLGLAPAEIDRIRLAAELHDIGKAAMPDALLAKPGRLDRDEWELIRRHPVIGERVLRAAPSLAHTADLVRSHHERVDGAGYPDGLRGDEIPVGARIIAVCDAFDDMVCELPYSPARPVADALAELRRCAGTQFDPAAVEAFAAAVAATAVAA